MRTLLLGVALLAAVLVACGGGGDSEALERVKADCLNPYGIISRSVCRQALDGGYTGDNESETQVECRLLEATREAYWNAGYIGFPGRVHTLYEELCEED